MIADRTHRRADAPGLSDADWQSPAITAGLTAHASLVARFGAKRPIRFRYQNAELIIDVVPPLAKWVMPTARALVELLALHRGWDSYDAPRIDPRSVEAAMTIPLE